MSYRSWSLGNEEVARNVFSHRILTLGRQLEEQIRIVFEDLRFPGIGYCKGGLTLAYIWAVSVRRNCKPLVNLRAHYKFNGEAI